MTALIAGLPGGMEWVILLVVALLLFGGTRLAGMGKGAGRAIREFKEEVKAPTGTIEPPKEAPTTEDVSEPVDAEIVTPETRKDK
ncbi:MAG TPA: twin-arginine translocase TatA/TatE family subunit [Propionibacteriaceae bacterium]|nr:twin-arginine translocase TatA/TatE family subunit [Propionibacteriaceae bacterium]